MRYAELRIRFVPCAGAVKSQICVMGVASVQHVTLEHFCDDATYASTHVGPNV
jgi:hypothetical protein